MRIAFFADNFLPQTNGAVTATLNLIKGLADRGHNVFVIAPKYRGYKEFSYKNVIVKRIPSLPSPFYPELKTTSPISFEIFNYIKNQKIDVIHLNSPLMLSILAIIISKILKIPLVGTFHTFFGDPQYLKNIGLNFKIFEYLSWKYSKLIYSNCNLLTSPSESTKKDLISQGINKNIQVISNGIDNKIFDNSKSRQVRNKLNPRGPLILFIGRISHEKNIFYLIDCIKLAAKKIPKVKLLIIGDGPQMNELKDKIKQLKLENNVILAGKIDHDKLIKSSIFKACDLFVTASITENQPMTILEAQVNGLACIGIDKRGVKDLIKNNYNGYLVNLGDKEAFANAIIKVISNKSLHKKMQQNTLKEIEKHKIKSVLDMWEKELSELIYLKNH